MSDSSPVHWLENVDGDPQKLRTACGQYTFVTMMANGLLDPNREAKTPVTCPGCLATMVIGEPVIDEPTIVEVSNGTR